MRGFMPGRTRVLMRARVALFAMSMLVPSPFALAAPADASANAAAMFRLQSSVQRLTQENEELQAQLALRDAELQGLRGTTPPAAASAPSSGDAAAARAHAQLVARYAASQQQATALAERANAKIEELAGKYRELAETLRKTEGDREVVRRDGERHLQRSLACEAQNARLGTLALEALDRYEGKGWWKSVLAAEPFTQLARVRLENQLDEYRHDVEALYVDAGGVPTAMPARRAATGNASVEAMDPARTNADEEGDEPVFEDYPVPGGDEPAGAQSP